MRKQHPRQRKKRRVGIALNDFERESELKRLREKCEDTLGERIEKVARGYTGPELKALMEARWNAPNPQSSVHRARWLVPGRTGGYMINPKDTK